MKPRPNVTAKVFRSFDEAEQAERLAAAASDATERLSIMWRLALDTWSFTGEAGAESRLPRSVVRIHRLQGRA